MSDRLALANAFEDAGIPRDKAQNLASVIINTVQDNAATKADVQASTAALKADIAATRADLQLAVSELKRTMTVGGIVALSAWGSALFGALHLWPPHIG